MQSTSAPTERRRLIFSLRALLVFITVFGLWLGWQANAARKQKRAVAAMHKSLGQVYYDFQYDPGAPPPLRTTRLGLTQTNFVDLRAIPPGPRWLRERLGEDYFQTAVAAFFINGIMEADTLEELANLPRLRYFGLGYAKVHDQDLLGLKGLAELESLSLYESPIEGSVLALIPNPTKLRHLDLNDTNLDDAAMLSIGKMVNLLNLTLRNTRITDMGLENLRNLSKLESLDLRGTNVSDAGLAYLRHLPRLIQVQLKNTKITDAGLQYLKTMRSLRYVEIGGTSVTSEAAEELKAALPNLYINGTP